MFTIVISVFDDDKNGTMDFGEFILATNCTSLSDPQAKVRCFGHYGDLYGAPYILVLMMFKVHQSISDLQGKVM